MSGSPWSDTRVSSARTSHRSVVGGIVRGLFSGIAAVNGVGLAVTGILCLTTASPLDGLEGRTLPTLGFTALMISPYIGLVVVARMLAGGRVWRSVVLLGASMLVTGYGLLMVARLWFLAVRPVGAEAVYALVMKQWIALGAAILVAIAPGLIIGWTVDRAGAAGSRSGPGGEPGADPR